MVCVTYCIPSQDVLGMARVARDSQDTRTEGSSYALYTIPGMYLGWLVLQSLDVLGIVCVAYSIPSRDILGMMGVAQDSWTEGSICILYTILG